MSAIVRIGDLNRDGRGDVVAREAATGYLWFYPGTATGLGARKMLGTGWNNMREITGIGDHDGDGYPDVLAVRTSSQNLYLYRGRPGATLAGGVLVGAGDWNTMSELTGIGNLTGDARPDLVARLSSDGRLFVYPGQAGGFGPRRQIGTGWNAMRDLAGVGDFNRDGRPDLVAVRISNGNLYLYRGTATALRGPVLAGSGYGGRNPVL